jgi:hypothetical protein
LSGQHIAAQLARLIKDREKSVKRFFAEVAGIVEAAVTVEAIDRRHLSGAEREIEQCEIFREARR